MVGARATTGQRENAGSGLALLMAALAWLALPACGENEAVERLATEVPAAFSSSCPPALEPRRAPLPQLASCEEEEAAAARRLEGTADAVPHARRAAELALARALREDDPIHVRRAREHLTLAARRRGLDGACEAGLEIARLEARDAADPGAAYVEAHRTVRRFDDGAHQSCVAEARRMLEILASFRPSAATLAAVDSDPDGDDPSLGLAADDEPTGEPEATADTFAAWARAQPAGTAATLSSLSTYGGAEAGGSARVVLTLSGVVRFESSELPADDALPRRVAILLAATALGPDVVAATAVGAGGLVRVRAASDGPGARVTLDLEGDAVTTLFVLPDPFRVIVDVRRGQAATPPTTGPQPVRLLVLDPGHGGDDYGARAFDLEEQDITLDLAFRVREILRTRLPSTRVVLTREEDRFVSLEQRTAMANAVSADAFVSIHLNAAWEDVLHGGVTTFVLDTTDDRQAVRLAARENGTSESEVGALSRILASLHREEQEVGSRALAERIHGATLAGGRRVLPRLYDRGVRSAMFHVLVGATMPAVLVEASFMTRREEADALRTEEYRQALAEGIADGIVGFARGGP